MKPFLLLDKHIGPAQKQYLEAFLIQQFAPEQFVSDISQADVIIAVGEINCIEEKEIEGKQLYQTTIQQILKANRSLFDEIKQEAVIYKMTNITPNTVIHSEKKDSPFYLLAITACPTGVAHTFMSAEAIEAEAQKRGWVAKVETRGSVGVGNEISEEEIAQADLIIAAIDIDVNLNKFSGKKLYRTSTAAALKRTAQEFDFALSQATLYQSPTITTTAAHNNKKTSIYNHLLTGVSYMLPVVVAGGLMIALAFAFGGINAEGILATALKEIGITAFQLMVPVLAGYISYSIADRPGLTPGLAGGLLAVSLNSGFLGGIIAGFIAGYLALAFSRYLKLPQSMEALKPILLIPLFATLITGLVMIFIVGKPVANFMNFLINWLNSMNTTNAIILGAILGAMMCSDMGGPINKAAYTFGTTLLSAQVYLPMAAIMAAGMIPPLAMGIATLIAGQKFTSNEKEGGKAALILGLCFISEGAIPFAAKDPLRVIPFCMVGGAITGALSMLIGAELMTAHGGLFVLAIPGAITHITGYLTAIIIGTLVTGASYALTKPHQLTAKSL